MSPDRAPSSLPRPVWLLGWVSLATDAATEAVYPLLPFFLTQVLGAGAVSLGVIEGAAEATNSILKIASGRAADRSKTKRWLVVAGYGLSSAVRPLIAAARGWTEVLAIRIVDRVGKGIRGAPRDAMLAEWATVENRGRVFGFHRAMDHAGAVIGPLLATIFLWLYPGEYRALFALTLIPGAIAVALIFLVPDAGRRSTDRSAGPAVRTPSTNPESSVALPRQLIAFLVVLTIFTLGNSTDAFLLLKLTDAAGSAQFVPLMWAGLHVVKASVSTAGGVWSDRIGRRTVIATGWLIYAAVYAGFAFATRLPALLGLFLAYGLYFGFTEGTAKAFVADLAPAPRRGFAFGIHDAVQGLGSLFASVIFGLLWTAAGPVAAFGAGAALALIASVLLVLAVR